MSPKGGRVQIIERPVERAAILADVPIAFTVDRVLFLEVHDDGLKGVTLREIPVAQPWVKDYDAVEGEGPTQWAEQFDVSRWGLFTAEVDGQVVGGAAIAFDTERVHMLEGRKDLAVLWDLRVRPEARSAGTGTLLFRAAESWARDRDCREIKVETQNVNVPACHFYRRMGCTLRSIDRLAYRGLPHEVQLIWSKEI